MRLPSATKEAWRAAADAAGLPLSQWVETLVNRALGHRRKLMAAERTLSLPFPADAVAPRPDEIRVLALPDILPARRRAPKKKKKRCKK